MDLLAEDKTVHDSQTWAMPRPLACSHHSYSAPPWAAHLLGIPSETTLDDSKCPMGPSLTQQYMDLNSLRPFHLIL